MALKIQNDRVVKLSYRLVDTNGRVIEERTPETPYEYMQGRSQIVAAVERVLDGRTAGYRGEVAVSPREAFGEYDPSLVVEIPRAHFPKGMEVGVGMKFNTTGPKGDPITVRVIEVQDTIVTVDGNHPLAGVELRFEFRVLDVREPTVEETETGRVSSPSLPPGAGSLH